MVFEALLLALVGAQAGTMVAWLLFNGREIMVDENVYPLVVSPRLVASGIVLALLLLALLGSLPPALRAQ